MTDADPAASALDEIRERSMAALEFPLSGFAEDSIRACTQSALDVPRLLAAVEAALNLPAEWRQESEALRDAAGKVWEDAPDAPGVRLKHAYAAGYAECAKALEAAITAALTGENATTRQQEESHE